MVGRSKKREDTSPNREQLRRDKDVKIHRRATPEPQRFVPELSLRHGVTLLDVLRGEDRPVDPPESSERR